MLFGRQQCCYNVETTLWSCAYWERGRVLHIKEHGLGTLLRVQDYEKSTISSIYSSVLLYIYT